MNRDKTTYWRVQVNYRGDKFKFRIETKDGDTPTKKEIMNRAKTPILRAHSSAFHNDIDEAMIVSIKLDMYY